MMKFLTPPNEYKGKKNENIIIFLAGPIQGAADWQKDIYKDLSKYENILIVSPRRETPPKNFDYTEQVEFETKYLELSDIIVFWVPKQANEKIDRVYGQTTRIEMGEWFCKSNNKKIIVGIDDSFPSKRYLKYKLENQYNSKVLNTYESVLNNLKKEIDKIQNELPKIFFTSDTHFSSDRHLELSKRPFKSVPDMDKHIMMNWNSIIRPNDVVYHLGDFGDYSMLNKLNGNIHLIIGNYEKEEMKKLKMGYKEYVKYLKKFGFKSVSENMIFSKNNKDIFKDDVLKLKDFDFNYEFYLVHEPLNCNKNMFNVFGHIHRLQAVKRYGLNVGIDSHNYYPVSLNDVIFYKKAIEKFYDDNVFE
jgi:calcineurin-like phosphoesterase family protein